MNRIASSLVAVALTSVAVSPAHARGPKKLSLAELAALEWKIEQASSALIRDEAVKGRLKAIRDLSSVTDHRVVNPLARALREDPDPGVRLEAAKALSAVRTPESKGVLTLASTADPDGQVRATASKALSQFPRRMEVAALELAPLAFNRPGKVDGGAITRLLSGPSGDGRLWAVQQARGVSFRGREQLIKKHLTDDPSSRVRSTCAGVLAAVAGKRALPALIRAAGDGDPAVRFEVARVLSRYDDPGALVAVQKLAADDPNATVRAEAKDLLEPSSKVGTRLLRARIEALASANPAQRISALDELAKFTHWRAMVPMSCALINDSSSLVRTAAARTLTDMHDTSVLTALRVAAVIEPDPKLKQQVRSLLQGLRRRVDGLIKQLGDADPVRRLLAARALGQAAYPPGLKSLIGALKDQDPRVRRAAARGLTNFAADEVSSPLRVAGSDSDPGVRVIVDRHFKQQDRLKGWRKFFGDPNRMVTKTMDPDPSWRSSAAIALGLAGAEASVGTLIQLLFQDKDEGVRLAAAWSLRLMGDAGEKALRTAAAKDKSERVRLAARKYLVIHKVSVDDLLTQLSAESADVRRDAAQALSLRASSAVMNQLIRAAMCDPSADVRARALRGLARIGNPLARTVINVAQARDADKEVKRVAMMMYILAGGK